jgi:hypothetical protein
MAGFGNSEILIRSNRQNPSLVAGETYRQRRWKLDPADERTVRLYPPTRSDSGPQAAVVTSQYTFCAESSVISR